MLCLWRFSPIATSGQTRVRSLVLVKGDRSPSRWTLPPKIAKHFLALKGMPTLQLLQLGHDRLLFWELFPELGCMELNNYYWKPGGKSRILEVLSVNQGDRRRFFLQLCYSNNRFSGNEDFSEFTLQPYL